MTRQMTVAPGMPRPMVRGAMPGGPRPDAAASAMTIKDVLGIIRRRLWMIILSTVLGTMIGVGLWAYFWKFSPEYTSVGYVTCKVQAQSVLAGFRVMDRPDIIEQETQTRALDLRSEDFLADILERSNIRASNWYKEREDNPEKMMDDMKSGFSASPQRGTKYIAVSMSARSSAEAKLFVDESLIEFQNRMRSEADRSLNANLTALDVQRKTLENDVKELRTQLESLNLQAKVPGWERGRTVITEELSTLHQERLRLEALISELNFELQKLQEEQRRGQSTRVAMALDQDATLRNWKNREALLEEDYNILLGRLGEDHRQVVEVKTRLQSLQEQIRSRELQLGGTYSASELSTLEKQRLSLAEQYDQVVSDFEEASRRQQDLDDLMLQYRATESDIEVKRKSLDLVNQRIYEIRVELGDDSRIPAEIARNGNVPLTKSFPKFVAFVPGGFFLGLLLSAGLAFLLDFMDDSVKTPSDISRHLQVPLLGMIPEYDEDDLDEIEVAKLTLIHPQEIFSEFFRRLRTNLMFSAPKEDLKVILVTSPASGCGKTTIATNLAIVLAAESRKVLLVDANFRRPAIEKLFPDSSENKGLSNYLIGQGELNDMIQKAVSQNLDVLKSGPTPPNPSELLSGERMKDFVANARKSYDHVIIDGSPALVVTDAQVLAGLSDGTMVVVNAGKKTGRGIVQRLLRELKGGGGVRVLGAVLNAVKPRKGGYFRETYENYYDYVGHES